MKLKKHSETDFLNLDNCLNHKLLTKDNGDNSVPNKNSDKYKLNFNKNTK
jgi:hypothetical protein